MTATLSYPAATKIINTPRTANFRTGISRLRQKWPELPPAITGFLFILLLTSCSGNTDKSKNESAVANIVQEAINRSGGDKYDEVFVSFNFRDKAYSARYKDGIYEYTRQFTDSVGTIRDVLSNNGFYRLINGSKADIPDSMALKYSNSVNSVIYFALLPKGLSDPAVILHSMGETEIKGKEYDKVLVNFHKKEGGKDYQDDYIYWFNKKSGLLDYLAYSYATDGGGLRFRVAYNPRTIQGIRFVDYINYEPNDEIELANIDEAYLTGKLKELSRIDLKNIEVKSLKVAN